MVSASPLTHSDATTKKDGIGPEIRVTRPFAHDLREIVEQITVRAEKSFRPPKGYVLASTNLLRRNKRKKDDTDEMLAFEERNTIRKEMLKSA